VPYVADEQIRPDVSRQARHVELLSLVERTATDEHLTPLIEAQAPSKGLPL
jgi:hypothetical protein